MKKCRTCGRVHTGVKHRWAYKTGKVKGGFAETDFGKKTITLDKSKHRRGAKTGHRTPNPDGSESMSTSILHELGHKNHPKMTEKGVENLAKAMNSRMSPKQKKRLYSKFQK